MRKDKEAMWDGNEKMRIFCLFGRNKSIFFLERPTSGPKVRRSVLLLGLAGWLALLSLSCSSGSLSHALTISNDFFRVGDGWWGLKSSLG